MHTRFAMAVTALERDRALAGTPRHSRAAAEDVLVLLERGQDQHHVGDGHLELTLAERPLDASTAGSVRWWPATGDT